MTTSRHTVKGVFEFPKEDQEQREVARYLDLKGVRWCHVPNGGGRSKVEAAIFQGLGVKSGVPDVLIFDPPPKRPEVRGVAVELKRQKGAPSKVSENQLAWLADLQAAGWLTHIAYGAADAIEWLIEVCGF